MTPPTPAALVRALEAEEISLSEFRARLRSSGTPLVEETTEAGFVDVTFVHDITADDAAAEDTAPDDVTVTFRSLIERSLPNDADHELQLIPGTPIRHLTLRLPRDLRFTYGFAVAGPVGPPRPATDPHNHHRDPRDPRLDKAIAVLPDAADIALPPTSDGPDPHQEEITWASEILGNERPVWISLPPTDPSGPASDPALPYVILFDGAAEHLAPRVRDHLLAGRAVRPFAVVLVDPVGLREHELTADPDFSRALATELAPLLRERYGLSQRAADVALSGSSFGGLCAGWTALQYPEVFGHAIMQSPSCWYHPELALQKNGPENLQIPSTAPAHTTPTPLLIAAFREAAPAPIRLWQECGDLEFGPPPAKVWQILGNRWLHDILVAKGYDTSYREFRGGHDASWWRGTWADAVRWAFPA